MTNDAKSGLRFCVCALILGAIGLLISGHWGHAFVSLLIVYVVIQMFCRPGR